jgi:hypothetical protein
LKVALNRGEWMRQVASFSLDVARLLAKTGEPAGTPEAQALLARYGHALNIDARELDELFAAVAQEMTSLLESMNLEPMSRQEEPEGDGLPNVLLLATLDAGEEEQGSYPSGKPKNARDLLLAGVQDVTQMRASGEHKVNDVVLAVLETLYTAMGFRFATVVLKDVRSGQYRARVSFGADKSATQAGFAFPVPAAPGAANKDLFFLAMANNADLMISDATSPKIRDLLPLAPPAAAGREELHRAAAGGGPGPARPVLRRPHPGRAGRRAAGRNLADQGAQGPGTGCACALTKSPNSRAGIGRPNK